MEVEKLEKVVLVYDDTCEVNDRIKSIIGNVLFLLLKGRQ